MKNALYERMAETIHECYSWLDVKDHTGKSEMMLQIDGELKKISYRTLSLVVKRQRGSYCVGHVFNIPEYQIDSAVKALKIDAVFLRHLQRGDLTYEDINSIIHHATFGCVDLDLHEPY